LSVSKPANMIGGMKKPADPEVRLLHALADPARLAIVRQLQASGEVCACDFTGCCGGLAQPTVSHHLKVLREAGLIRGQRRGSWVWYSLDPDGLARLASLTQDLTGLAVVPAGPRH
jgi:ArsR family transcriptional regulator